MIQDCRWIFALVNGGYTANQKMKVFYVNSTKYLYANYLFASYWIIFLIFVCIFGYCSMIFRSVQCWIYDETRIYNFLYSNGWFIQTPVPALLPRPHINLTARTIILPEALHQLLSTGVSTSWNKILEAI